MDAVLGYVLVNVLQVTSWLEVSSVWIKVIVCHSLLDAHTEAHTLMGEGVNGIHKLSIIRRQSVCGGHALKQWPRWIETWTDATCSQEPVQNILLHIIFVLASEFRKHHYYPSPAENLTSYSSNFL